MLLYFGFSLVAPSSPNIKTCTVCYVNSLVRPLDYGISFQKTLSTFSPSLHGYFSWYSDFPYHKKHKLVSAFDYGISFQKTSTTF